MFIIRESLKEFVGKLIEKIDLYQARHHELDENDDTKKIIDTIDVSEQRLRILTDTGYEKVTHIHKTQPYRVYTIETENGEKLSCADNHKLFFFDKEAGRPAEEVFVKDLKKGDCIAVFGGKDYVKSITKHGFSHSMYDLTIDSKNHRYYTNNILSHNTTTIVAIIAWILCFSTDKNILVMANKGATAKEIISKLVEVFKGLPFFLKPGCISFNTESIVLDNGCRIISQTTTASSAIGFTIDMLYLDEFAHVDRSVAYEFWRSVYPTISASKTSRCIITSTPNGMSNKFFDIWDGSQKGLNSFASKKVYWWQVPGRDAEWERKTRSDFGDNEFDQEFNLSFSVSSTMLLKARDLKYLKRISKEYVQHDLNGLRKELNDKLTWHPDFDPYSIDYMRDAFVLSLDTAQGSPIQDGSKLDSDYNVLNIFKLVPMSEAALRDPYRVIKDVRDCFRLVQIGIYLDNKTNEKDLAEVAKYTTFNLFRNGIGDIDNTRVLVEVNFNGGRFMDVFRSHDNFYDNVLIHTAHRVAMDGEFIPLKAGYKTTPGNRSYYIDLGRDGIEQRRIITTHTDKKANLSTEGQLSSFGKNKKGKYEGIAIHDDISMTTLNLSRLFDSEEFLYFLSNYYETFLEGMPTYISSAINSYYSNDEQDLYNLHDGIKGALQIASGYSSRDEEIYDIYRGMR